MSFDLVVIGSGPGGYVAAIRAAQLGLKTACVEKDARLGGTCLNVGCIPSKALLESSHKFEDANKHFALHGIKVSGVQLDLPAMMKRKDVVVKGLTDGVDLLFKKNKVERINGFGKIIAPGKVEVTAGDGKKSVVETKRILIATGSVPTVLRGITLDNDRIVDSTGALSFPEVPKHLGIIGAGVIGLELGSVWARLGAKVTVLEYLDRALNGMDAQVASQAQRVLQQQGLEFRLGRRVQGASVKGKEVVVEHADANNAVETLTCDRLLVATGRKPFTEGLGLQELGVTMDKMGRVLVNAHYETNVPGIFAIGDVIPGPMLAHKAEDEGVAACEYMATGYGHVNYDAIPNVVYTHPEIASVGKTEEELKSAGIPFKKGVYFFKANSRARAIDDTTGFVKFLAHEKTDRLLGAHIIGPAAGDLIAECGVVIEFEGSAEDIARSSHAHPTLAEAVKEAGLAVHGRTINA